MTVIVRMRQTKWRQVHGRDAQETAAHQVMIRARIRADDDIHVSITRVDIAGVGGYFKKECGGQWTQRLVGDMMRPHLK